ncbi:MAG: glutamate--tRNA ligase family protein, partial [Vicinamibacteria bacterium]
GECVMRDVLRGEIHKDWATVDDQVILKSDGFPTYHLANVVDDHLMAVSHVIRGEEWINSVPKHLKLYEYFGWEPPVFCHLPLLRNNDKNKSKLSKRKNPTSINYFRRAGFLPEALRNFMGLMGWWPPDGEEKFTTEKMIDNFRLDGITLGGPVFDVEKLRWLNARYIREDYDTASLRTALESWGLGAEALERIIPLAQPRMETLSDWGYLTAFFFSDAVPYEAEELQLKGKTPDELKEILQTAIWRLEQERSLTSDAIEKVFRDLSARLDISLRDLSRPFYVALTGAKAATPLFQSMEILGLDIVRMRLRRAIDSLGGISSKKMRALEKDYAASYGGQD